MKGRFSDKTFGGGGFKINKNGGSDRVYIGKEYKARGNIKVNGKEVGKKGLHLGVKGGIHGDLDFKDTKTGKGIHLGGDAEGQAKANINKGKVTTLTKGLVKGRKE